MLLVQPITRKNDSSTAVAIICKDKKLSYRDYFLAAIELGILIKLLIKNKKENISILLPKNFNVYIGINAVLIAECCYVPIDYLTPLDKINYILRDSETRLLITTSKKLKQLIDKDDLFYDHEVNHTNVVIYDIFTKTLLARYNAHNSYINNQIIFDPMSVEPSIMHHYNTKKDSARKDMLINFSKMKNLPAVLLYSSGSTGKQKGILHSHKSVSTFIEWAINHLNLSKDNKIAQVASLTFDLSTFDIFASLKSGATLVPVPESIYGNMNKICDFIAKYQITIWYSVPSVFLRTVNEHAWSKLKNTSLRHIVFAGEIIPKNNLKEFYKFLPQNCAIHNWYGPTETNVCTYYNIKSEDIMNDEPIPIGYCCPYVRISSTKELGEKFELIIESSSLMLGYWKHILKNENLSNIYYTGDIVYYGEKGKLIFFARKDRQIKVNGYRIQPEEIEYVLCSHPHITMAVCVLLNDLQEVKLAVWILPSKNISEAEIKLFCKKYLNYYMFPDFFFLSDNIPMTGRGKIDYGTIKAKLSQYYQSNV